MTEFTTWRSLVDGAEITDIPDSVVTRWAYEDDTDTTTAIDSVGSNDGNITLGSGSFDSANAKCGQFALNSDGEDTEVVSQNALNLFTTGDQNGCSLATYVNMDNSGDTIHFAGWGDDTQDYLSIVAQDNTYRAQVSVDNNLTTADSGVAPSESWDHVVGAIDANDVWIIIDGTEQARSAHGVDPSNIGSANLYAATRAGGGSLAGLVDNSDYLKRGATESDAQELINSC